MYKIILYKTNTLILSVRHELFFYQLMGKSVASIPQTIDLGKRMRNYSDCENLMSNNFLRTAVLKKYDL